jgi:hypothetical protein
MHRVDIRTLKKQGYLAGKNETITRLLSWADREGEETGSIVVEVHDDHIYLKYTANKEYIEEKVIISKRPCNFGGYRKYLLCPGCGKRVVTLYGGKYFRCRHCYDFCYSSQLETPPIRLSRKARKLAEKVAGDDKDYDQFPMKQPQKHRKKHERLRREHDRILRRAWSYVAHHAPGMDYPFG